MTDGSDGSPRPSSTPPGPGAARPPRVAAPAEGGWGRRLSGRSRRLTLLGVLVATLLLLAAGAVAAGLMGEQDTDEPEGLCLSTRSVRVVADPSLAPSLERVAEQARGSLLSTGVCADVTVVAQDSAEAAEALAGAGGADGGGAGGSDVPQLWVPDSSVWLGRAVADPPGDDLELTALGSLVSSPLVVAAGPEVVTEAGWAADRPGWQDLLAQGRPLATAELATSAVSVQALVALQSTLDDPAEARSALAQAAAALERGTVEDTPAALDLARADGADAPLVPTTEQQVFQANRGSAATDLVAVQPADGPTSLDYPVVRVDTSERGAGVDAAAVEGVVRLLETAGREAALADGFRAPLPLAEPSSEPSPDPSADPSAEATVEPSPAPSVERVPGAGAEALVVPVPRSSDVDVLLEQLAELNRPSRVLAVLDASTSMRGVTGTGATRAQVVQQAVTDSFGAFGDSSTVGLWFFADGLGTDAAGAPVDHVEVVPLRSLDPAEAGVDQRAELAAGAATLGDRLAPGGTGLFDSTLAAVRALQQDDDPEAVTTVVLVTDGRQEDAGGIGLEELVATLRAEADPEQPVRVLPIGIGADVAPEELRAVAEATGGTAYLAETAEDFPTVLDDALRRR